MPFSGGTYSLPAGNPVTTNTTITSSWANTTMNDIATALSTCVLKDGTQTITANIPMSSFKFTGLAAGSTSGDSVRYQQVLLLAGGTMAGDIAMGGFKLTGLTSGTATGQSIVWDQAPQGLMTTTGDIIYASAANTPARLAIGTADLPLVVNAGATAPQWGFATKTANTVYSGPSSGSAAAPAFRALVQPDIPTPVLGTAQATTTGTAFNFTIPTTTKPISSIDVTFKAVSMDGSDNILIQLGNASGVAATGYVGVFGSIANAANPSTSTLSAGFGVGAAGAGASVSGFVKLALHNSTDNTWVASGMCANPGDATLKPVAGYLTLTSAITTVRVTRTGTNNFDAGEVNVNYT